MSCGCNDSPFGYGPYGYNPYGSICAPELPYPQVSAESVPSLINNLTNALYGQITKSVVNGKIVWSTCDVNNNQTIFGITRNAGEGLLCYLLRGLSTAGTNGQVLTSTGTGIAWSSTIQAAVQNSIYSQYAVLANSANSVNGVITNSNASTGQVGEFISSSLASGSGVTLSTQTAATITSITLTAGDWDVRGQVDYYNGGLNSVSVTILQQGISTNNNSFLGQDTYSKQTQTTTAIGYSVGIAFAIPVRTQRLSLASTTNVYLVAQSTFSGSGLAACGTIEARRIR